MQEGMSTLTRALEFLLLSNAFEATEDETRITGLVPQPQFICTVTSIISFGALRIARLSANVK